MFSWATSHLEKLAQTVAPPAPNDSFAALRLACQQGNDDGAVACVYEQQQQQGVDPLTTIIQPLKGQTILHWACLYGLPKLLHVCLTPLNPPALSDPSQQQQQQQQQFNLCALVDLQGHTPLHYAAMSDRPNALDMVKLVVQYAGTTQSTLVPLVNHMKQTAYDVAVRDSVRQYLLPLQLQAETQAALDNGGVGLPPGMDLGGLTIQHSHLPPPPIMGPPSATMPSSTSMGVHSLYAPTPGLASNVSTPPLPNHPALPMATQPLSLESTLLGTSATSIDALPKPPTSTGSNTAMGGAYARTGRSSAAILPTRGGIQPDGFHSSSSDKNLQEKYGHVSSNAGRHLPPPPSSGNTVGLDVSATAASSTGHVAGQHGSAPPSLGTGANPFAGGMAAVHRTATTRRYVAYEPYSTAPRPPVGTGFGAPTGGPATAPLYTTFAPPPPVAYDNPVAAPAVGHSAPAVYESYPMASPAAPAVGTFTPANTPVVPTWQPPGSTAVNDSTYSQAGQPLYPGASHSTVAATLFAATPTKAMPESTTPTASLGTTPPPPPFSGFRSHGSTTGASPDVAAALFAQPASTAGSPMSTATPEAASQAFAPLVAGTSLAPTRTASELFGSAATADAATVESSSVTPAAAAVPTRAHDVGNDDDLAMDDIPLTPADVKAIVQTSTGGGGGGVEANRTASNSLFGAIGMPPPPFSKK